MDSSAAIGGASASFSSSYPPKCSKEARVAKKYLDATFAMFSTKRLTLEELKERYGIDYQSPVGDGHELYSSFPQLADSRFIVHDEKVQIHMPPASASGGEIPLDPRCCYCSPFDEESGKSKNLLDYQKSVFDDPEFQEAFPLVERVPTTDVPFICEDCRELTEIFAGNIPIEPFGDCFEMVEGEIVHTLKVTRQPSLLGEGETRILNEEELDYHEIEFTQETKDGEAWYGTSSMSEYKECDFFILKCDEGFQVTRMPLSMLPDDVRVMNLFTAVYGHGIGYVETIDDSRMLGRSRLPEYKGFYFLVEEYDKEAGLPGAWDPAFSNLSCRFMSTLFEQARGEPPRLANGEFPLCLCRVTCLDQRPESTTKKVEAAKLSEALDRFLAKPKGKPVIGSRPPSRCAERLPQTGHLARQRKGTV